MRSPRELAIETQTFVAGLSAVCGGKVRIVFDGSACTDGATIHLPRPSDAMDEQHFRGLLGIGCHETAHVYYGSPKKFQVYTQTKLPKQQRLAADCFNAVLDVADETRLERRFRLARRYFAASTTLAAREYVTSGAAYGPCRSATEALVRGIFFVRRRRLSDASAHHALCDAIQFDPVSYWCACLLSQARTKRGDGLPTRTVKDWERLESISNQLVSFLDQQEFDPRAAEEEDEELTSSTDTSAFAGGGGMGVIFREVAVSATDGAMRFSSPPHAAATPASIDDVSQDAFHRAAPIFRRYARLLLEAPSPQHQRVSCSGTRLGDVTRLDIDGRIFLRKTPAIDVGTATAICLDCSQSMMEVLSEVAGTAWALADALQRARGAVGCFHFGSEVRRRPLRQMGRAVLLGSTRTDLAIEAAATWLETQAVSRRIIIVFTDGATDDFSATRAQANVVQRRGIQILAGVLPGGSHDGIAASLPWAQTFSISSDLLGGFQQAIRRIKNVSY